MTLLTSQQSTVTIFLRTSPVTGDVLRNRVTVHKQQIRDPHTRMLGVSKRIDECAAGLTPQFTIFPFYKILSPSEVMTKNKERFLISKYQYPFLMT